MTRRACLSDTCVSKRAAVLAEYDHEPDSLYIVCCPTVHCEILQQGDFAYSLTIVVCRDVIWKGSMIIESLSKNIPTIIALIAHNNASAQLSLFVKGGGSLECTLIAQGMASSVRLQGAYVARESEFLNLTTSQAHPVPNSCSTLTFSGIASGDAHVSYNGLIVIGPEAAGTSASQENKNIVIGRRAHVTSIPAIEVLNNEVQCTHGSAISYVDEEQASYLHARGIDPAGAQPLLLESFLKDVFEDSESAAYFNGIISCQSKAHGH